MRAPSGGLFFWRVGFRSSDDHGPLSPYSWYSRATPAARSPGDCSSVIAAAHSRGGKCFREGHTSVFSGCDGSGSFIGQNYCGPANPNSTGKSAVISAYGSTGTIHNSLTLTATELPLNVFAYLLNSNVQTFRPLPPGSDGNLCLGGGIGRHTKQLADTSVYGDLIVPVDLTDLPRPNGSHTVMAGETWNFQAWFRDKNPGYTSNFTDGVAVSFY